MTKYSSRFKVLFQVLSLLMIFIAVPSFAANKHLAKIHTIKGDVEAKYNNFIDQKIKEVGYTSTDPHKRVNDAYKKKYGSTNLDILSFMSIVNEGVVKPMFNVDPRIAAFNPFNMVIYKKLSDDTTKIGHLMPEAILDIIGISDKKLRADYIKSFEPLDALLEKEIGGEVSYIDIKKFAEDRMMNFEIPIDLGKGTLDDFIDDFQMDLEERFEEKEYIIAGFNNFKETQGEDTIPEYEAFWTYSLCHFKYSYTVFDTDGGVPEAGLFAPCTMYMYIKKGSNKIVVGMPRLENWGAMLGIEDKKRLDFMKKLDVEIPAIMAEVGAVETDNVNPLLAVVDAKKEAVKPKEKKSVTKKVAAAVVAATIATTQIAAKDDVSKSVVKEISKNEDSENITTIVLPKAPKPVQATKVVTVGGTKLRPRENVRLSTAIPLKVSKPAETIKTKVATSTDVGLAKMGKVSAYLRGDFSEIKDVQAKLESGGFKVLSTSTVDKKGKLTSIVFTNDALQNIANKKDRGFMASLRVLVDTVNKQISISNPFYFARAFMQDDNDEKIIKTVLDDITKIFGGLKNSTDKLKYTLLPKYHFMFAMPYYDDMIEVGNASSSQKLLDKVSAKSLVFSQVLSKDRILIGVKLGKRTSRFISKTGTNNALLLPYPILLENGVAKILDPKYYIAVSYPMLKMSQFMKISTVPGAIQSDCENLFK